ncbi:DUF5134 domain-containing protein [Streptomyces sp. NPDC058874]|uniref:DUF5134 domain-containing protein n=1 Tax=unclassified Streptomyces TaxID=2593676 RepID=UPI0036CEE11A
MHGSASPLSASVSAWLLVLLCAVSGGYCLRRACGGRGDAAGEAVMGIGMAVMAVPLGAAGAWRPPVLGAVFCAAAVHALWLLRGGTTHHLHHLVGSLTMVYMAAAAGSGGTHGHGRGAGPPLLTGLLLLYYAGYVMLGGTRLATGGGTAPGPPHGAPTELDRACRLAMGMGMLAMLLSM